MNTFFKCSFARYFKFNALVLQFVSSTKLGYIFFIFIVCAKHKPR